MPQATGCKGRIPLLKGHNKPKQHRVEKAADHSRIALLNFLREPLGRPFFA